MKKPKMTKDLLYIVLTLTIVIAMNVLSTLAGGEFDFDNFSEPEFWSNLLLNLSIVLVCTTTAIPYGISSTKLGGRYLNDYQGFLTVFDRIKIKLHLFSQWHTAKYDRELYDKQIKYLVSKGIKQADLIMQLDLSDLDNLENPYMKEINGQEVYFSSLTKKQIKACRKVFSGRVSIKKLPDYYFLYVEGKSGSTFYEQASAEKMSERMYLVGNVCSKIAYGFAFTCIWTGLVMDAYIYDNTELAKIIVNMLARIYSAVHSIFNGINIGQGYVYKTCYYINGKTQILEEFDSDNSIQYKDAQELAKEEYLLAKGDVQE